MSILFCLIPALAAAGLCAGLPVLIIKNLRLAAGLVGFPEAAPVLAQLSDAAISPAWGAIIACGAIVFLLALALRRHKIIATLIIIPVTLMFIVAALALMYVNNVPVYTMAEIAAEYLSSGAF